LLQYKQLHGSQYLLLLLTKMRGPPPRSPTLSIGASIELTARLLRQLRPHWIALLRVALFGLLLAVLALVPPYMTKLLVSNALGARSLGFMELLIATAALFSLLATLFGLVHAYLAGAISARIGAALSLQFFDHLQHLPISFFDESRIGDITSRFADLRSSLNYVSRFLSVLIVGGMQLVAIPAILLTIDRTITLVSLLSLPVTILVALLSARAQRLLWMTTAQLGGDIGAAQTEVFTNVRTTKAFGLEGMLLSSMRLLLEQHASSQLKSQRTGQAWGAFEALVRSLVMGVFGWYAWHSIVRGRLGIGDYFAAVAYLATIERPFMQFASLITDVQQLGVHLRRVFEYLDLPTEGSSLHCTRGGARPLTPQTVALSVRALSFGYPNASPVLIDVFLDIAEGETVAVMGESGVGKSTLLKLLPRFLTPSCGDIRLGGRRAEDVDLAEWRAHFSIVWQDCALLRGTLLTNLVLGAAVDRSTVEAAIERCELRPFIDSLPEGLETPVAEWGATLSAGQRQRVAWARAVIRNAPAVLLDEPTANLDAATEARILDNLRPWLSEHAVLIVTHRPSVTQLADRVLHLRDGRLSAVPRLQCFVETASDA
jgi:ABC-type bacteriocin/lantibiotic exporter with double-glycine peptidase domain